MHGDANPCEFVCCRVSGWTEVSLTRGGGGGRSAEGEIPTDQSWKRHEDAFHVELEEDTSVASSVSVDVSRDLPREEETSATSPQTPQSSSEVGGKETRVHSAAGAGASVVDCCE